MIRKLLSRARAWLPEGRPLPPGLALAALCLVGMSLLEVWQNSRLAQLSLALEQHRAALTRADARMEFVGALVERRTTRTELAPLAAELGLKPADAQQVVALPSEFLADRGAVARDGDPVPLWAWAERASRALVPEARAKGRTEN